MSITQPETNLQTQYEKYQKGQISKGEMMQAVWSANNQSSQNLFGKVVDQYGDPVIGADVTGSIELIQGFDIGEKFELHKTQTDGNGLFQFTGLKGSRLDAEVTKNGYEINYGVARTGPSTLDSSPSNRQVFTMWKLKGPEPMVHARLHAYIPCDGSVTRFDLLTGKKHANGDLIVKLTRNPVAIIRGKHFDWSVTVEIANGGLQPITDLYPNEAPAGGYKSGITFNFPSDMPKWDSFWGHSFYFQSRGGQLYGRIHLSVQADFQPPPTSFHAEIYDNPAGSRNLEFDPQKQIR